MTTTNESARPLTARQVTWRRRRASARRTWTEFRGHRAGVVGLGILTLFTAVAIFAPFLADESGLKVTQATGGVLEPPSAEYPLGTDDNGRSILTLLIWGTRVSLFVGLLAGVLALLRPYDSPGGWTFLPGGPAVPPATQPTFGAPERST